MSNKKAKEKLAAKSAELKKRKQIVADMNSHQYRYSRYVTVGNKNNGLWGKFVHLDKVHIHIATCYCGATIDKGKGKVYMTVRANPDDSRALSQHMYSDDLEAVVAKFDEYVNLAKSVPENADWDWYIAHGFQYDQV